MLPVKKHVHAVKQGNTGDFFSFIFTGNGMPGQYLDCTRKIGFCE